MRVSDFRNTLRAAVALFVVSSASISTPTSTEAQIGTCGSLCLYYCPPARHEYCQMQYGGLCGMVASCETEEPCVAGLTIKLKCGLQAVEQKWFALLRTWS